MSAGSKSGTARGEAGSPAPITDLPELLAHAHAIEQEAVERYADLAAQMETHNNPELAAMFGKLTRIERIHADQILARAKGMQLPHIPPWEYKWPEAESPESPDVSAVHYLMTPHHALSMALAAEQRALRFYEVAAKVAVDGGVRALAEEFAEAEREHVRLMGEWLARYPAPEHGWDEDPDPPATQE